MLQIMKTLLAVVTACLMTINIHADEMQHGPSVSDSWIRATPPGATTSAMYMMIKNSTDKPMTLVDVKSALSDRIEIHHTVKNDGVMQMRKIDRIDVNAHAMTELKPQGQHIMFFNLKEALAPESKITVDLIFEDGTTITAEVPVMKQGMSHDSHSEMKSEKHKDH